METIIIKMGVPKCEKCSPLFNDAIRIFFYTTPFNSNAKGIETAYYTYMAKVIMNLALRKIGEIR